ncbi:rop guanine nucleotide exchange factor [Trifolium repens]|nr:rop guanine nucleotide exchange factor [Trifolium repens]
MVASITSGSDASAWQSKGWWLSPQVPKTGLSDTERKRLVHQGRVVHQVFKAAKSINENVLLEMHVQQVFMMHLQSETGGNLANDLWFLEFLMLQFCDRQLFIID